MIGFVSCPARRFIYANHVSPPIPTSHGPQISLISEANLLRLLSSLTGLDTTGLLNRSILLGELRAADGAHTGNSLLTDISTVAVLGGLIGDTLVDPERVISIGHKTNTLVISGCEVHLLAGGSAGAVGHGDQVLSGLLGVAGLLGGDGDTVLGGLDTDSLKIGNLVP